MLVGSEEFKVKVEWMTITRIENNGDVNNSIDKKSFFNYINLSICTAYKHGFNQTEFQTVY